MMALHGFLGQPSDWDGILGDEWSKPNWLKDLQPGPKLLERVANSLNSQAQNMDLLLGYSMGGRIALHMLLQSSQRWKGAIIVSASPGLTSDDERSQRLQNDQVWAERFLKEAWTETVQAWNSQTVFSQDPPDRLPRHEADYDRTALAAALVEGSVAKQGNLREALKGLTVPVLWIAGERDSKYAQLAEECAALNPLFQARVLSQAGHRAPWGNPKAFLTALEQFSPNS
jgi:2-succinyl-6-hydroxy-2,4-cyclohexadiene-1-carboxylate synthase